MGWVLSDDPLAGYDARWMWEELIASIPFRERPIMPYAVKDDLEPSVRGHLPSHAQDIFRAAFNNAFDVHFDDPEREEIAFRIAWAQVKRKYRNMGAYGIARDA
jgi:cation transport regulator